MLPKNKSFCTINRCILLQLQLHTIGKKRCAGKIKITISSQQQIVDGKIQKQVLKLFRYNTYLQIIIAIIAHGNFSSYLILIKAASNSVTNAWLGYQLRVIIHFVATISRERTSPVRTKLHTYMRPMGTSLGTESLPAGGDSPIFFRWT